MRPLELTDRAGRPVARLVVVVRRAGEAHGTCRGLIRQAARTGASVEVVVATTEPAAEDQDVAADSGVVHLDRDAGSLAGDVAGLAADLVAIVGDGRGVVLVGPWVDNGHPDLDALGRACRTTAARTGARSLGYASRPRAGSTAEPPGRDVRRGELEPAERAAEQEAIERDPAPDDELYVEQQPVDTSLEQLHAEHDEPWGADTRWYEARKRALLLAMLPRRRYARAWEVGCSTGALTAELRLRCDAVVGTDTSETAIAQARRRCDVGRDDRPSSEVGRVRIERRDAAEPWGAALPDGGFDLVVVSEVGYFLSVEGLERLVRTLRTETPDADVVLCHWRHDVVGWPLDGPTVHEVVTRGLGAPVLGRYVDRDVEVVVLGPESSRPDPVA